MNLPNKLTIIRFILTPIFMALMMFNFPFHYFLAFLVFVAASITDYFDGKIARKYNYITDFGKIMDPLADKMLTSLAFLVLVYQDIVPIWFFALVLVRDFAVDGMRMMVARNGKTVPASFYGKLKTTLQMTALIIILANQIFLQEPLTIIGNIVLYASIALSLYSGADYLIKGWKLAIKPKR